MKLAFNWKSDNLPAYQRLMLAILYSLTGILTFLLPFGIGYLPQVLSVTFFLLIIVILIERKKLKIPNLQLLYLPIVFLTGLISLSYTENLEGGLKILERQISLIGIPLLLVLLQRFIHINRTIFLGLLSISLFLSYCIVLGRFVSDVELVYKKSTSIVNFFYWFRTNNYLSFGHPTYFSALILIQIIYCISDFRKMNKMWKLFQITTAACGLIILILLNSRSAILNVGLISIYYLIKFFSRNLYKKASILLVFMIVTSVFISLNTRVGVTLKNTINESGVKSTRQLIWINCLKVIQEYPFLGVGIGDAESSLIKKYLDSNFTEGVNRKLNAHNQFLESWMQSGLAGLISIFLVFFGSFLLAAKRRDEILLLFTLVFLTISLFESIFLRLTGIVSFSFLICLLQISPVDPNKKYGAK